MKINKFFEEILGVTLMNPRWSWGAVDPESNRVYLRVWDDQIKMDGGVEKVQVYWKHPRTGSPGFEERVEQLEAIENGAQGFGIVTTAVDPEPEGAREIKSFDEHTLLELGEISEDADGKYALITGRIPTSNLEQKRALTPAGKAILQSIVNQIRGGRFLPDDEQSFMGYGDVHKELGLEKRGSHWGNSLNAQGLGNLALWIRQKHLPALTGLIVDQTNFEPGDGYYHANNRPLNDRSWWMDQIRQAIAFDWSPYVDDDPTPTVEQLQSYTSAVIEGTVNTVSVEVRTRCEALRRRAKQFYRTADGKLKCEVCGWQKPDNRISGDIVELHHMRPLAGLPDQGVSLSMREAIESLVPLCPCCHRIAHSRIGGRSFSLKELKNIIPQYQAAPLARA